MSSIFCFVYVLYIYSYKFGWMLYIVTSLGGCSIYNYSLFQSVLLDLNSFVRNHVMYMFVVVLLIQLMLKL